MEVGTKVRVMDWMEEYDTDVEAAEEFGLDRWEPWGDDVDIPIKDDRIYEVVGVKVHGEYCTVLALSDEFGRQFIIDLAGVEEIA